eukprot:5659676-Lingulodinium_polyedra.AAC.1
MSWPRPQQQSACGACGTSCRGCRTEPCQRHSAGPLCHCGPAASMLAERRHRQQRWQQRTCHGKVAEGP